MSSFFYYYYWDPYKKQEKTRIFNCSFCALKESGEFTEMRWTAVCPLNWRHVNFCDFQSISTRIQLHRFYWQLICVMLAWFATMLLEPKIKKRKRKKKKLLCFVEASHWCCFVSWQDTSRNPSWNPRVLWRSPT